MSFRLKPLFPAFAPLFCFALLTVPLSARADAGTTMAEAADQNAQETQQQDTANTTAITKALDDAAVGMIKAIGTSDKDQVPDGDSELQSTLTGMPQALMLIDTTVRDLVTNRLLESNLVSAYGDKQKPADYLIDPKMVSPRNDKARIEAPAQVFDIFMRYFCDPKSRGGTMKDVGGIRSDKYPNKVLGCGGVYTASGDGKPVSLDASTPSRDAVFGKEPDSYDIEDPVVSYVELQRNQIKNLPLRPNALFFDPTTFPVKAQKGAGDGSLSNGNPLAPVYYGAFAQALHFLIGLPQSTVDISEVGADPIKQGDFIDQQGLIARQMLASYPFAVLFAERVGSLDANIAQATSKMLSEKVGQLGKDDDILYNRIRNLSMRKSLSMAEYMDIVMYQVPMSPGYLNRINKLDKKDLQREKVWLTAMQTVLNYQRNRWLEMLTALEAAK